MVITHRSVYSTVKNKHEINVSFIIVYVVMSEVTVTFRMILLT